MLQVTIKRCYCTLLLYIQCSWRSVLVMLVNAITIVLSIELGSDRWMFELQSYIIKTTDALFMVTNYTVFQKNLTLFSFAKTWINIIQFQ